MLYLLYVDASDVVEVLFINFLLYDGLFLIIEVCWWTPWYSIPFN